MVRGLIMEVGGLGERAKNGTTNSINNKIFKKINALKM